MASADINAAIAACVGFQFKLAESRNVTLHLINLPIIVNTGSLEGLR
jgi:hypothetical protein